ncbi:rhomboid family intramembrane serine protease [Spongorhabdus nitratireducens]
MIQILEVPGETDLRPFSAFLWSRRIAHRITEDRGQQVLWLGDEEAKEQVLNWYRDWESGVMPLHGFAEALKQRASARSGVKLQGPLADWKRMPVTMLFLIVCGLVAIYTGLGHDVSVLMLTFTPPMATAMGTQLGTLQDTLVSGEYWRLFTPVLLHFGIMHLIFNMLWLFDLGRRIEIVQGSFRLLSIIILTGLLSNILQYLSGPQYALFGGFSGIVYGLLGYCLAREKFAGDQLGVPPGVYGFMLVWLAVGYTGILEAIGFGAMANAAHLGGLLAGLLGGWLTVVLGKGSKGDVFDDN